MPHPIVIPGDYAYVLAGATSTIFVNIYHSLLTSYHRKRSGITYPIAYADNEVAAKDPKAYDFNCAQRAHANFHENLAPFLIALGIAGISHPKLAGAMGVWWSISRVIYAKGYTSGNAKNRTVGSVQYLSMLPLLGISLYNIANWVLEL